jgi:hypothetical protein
MYLNNDFFEVYISQFIRYVNSSLRLVFIFWHRQLLSKGFFTLTFQNVSPNISTICWKVFCHCRTDDEWLYWQLDEFEDTKGVLRIRNSKDRQHNVQKKNDRQHNVQKKKDNSTNNDLQNSTLKTKRPSAMRPPLKIGGELKCSGRCKQFLLH